MSRMPQGSLDAERDVWILSVHNFFFTRKCSLDFTGVLLIDHVWVCLRAEQSFRMWP